MDVAFAPPGVRLRYFSGWLRGSTHVTDDLGQYDV